MSRVYVHAMKQELITMASETTSVLSNEVAMVAIYVNKAFCIRVQPGSPLAVASELKN